MLDEVLDDGGPSTLPGPDALAAHRALLGGDLRDLVATMVVPAARAAELAQLLGPADLGTRVLLASAEPDPFAALEALDAARARFWDDDRVEIVGRRLSLPADPADPVAAVVELLGLLAATVPTWITVPPGTPPGVLDVLARDGAENVTLDAGQGDAGGQAALVRALVDRDLTFRVAGAAGVLHDPDPAGPPGLLNLLCAVRAALNGAEVPQLAEVISATESAGLSSALRRMSAADGAVSRAFLVAVEVPDAAAAAAHLRRLGLADDATG